MQTNKERLTQIVQTMRENRLESIDEARKHIEQSLPTLAEPDRSRVLTKLGVNLESGKIDWAEHPAVSDNADWATVFGELDALREFADAHWEIVEVLSEIRSNRNAIESVNAKRCTALYAAVIITAGALFAASLFFMEK